MLIIVQKVTEVLGLSEIRRTSRYVIEAQLIAKSSYRPRTYLGFDGTVGLVISSK